MKAPAEGVALVAVALATLGDIFLAKAMRGGSGIGIALIFNPQMWTAVSLLLCHLYLWTWVLSRLDLSTAIPLTASSYVYNSLLVGPLLAETVSLRTWLGVGLIVLGVVTVARSDAGSITS